MSNIIKFPSKDTEPVYSRRATSLALPKNVISINHLELLETKKKCEDYMTIFGKGLRASSPVPDMLALEAKLDYTRQK